MAQIHAGQRLVDGDMYKIAWACAVGSGATL